MNTVSSSNEIPKYLRKRIKNTNFVSIIYGILALPFSIVTFLLFPEITWIPVLFLFIVALAYVLNRQELYHASRLFASLGTLFAGTAYIAAIQPANEPVFASLFALNFLFVIPPWIIYDLREKNTLILIVSLSFVSLLMFRVWDDLLSYDFPEEKIQLFRDGYMALLCSLTLIIFFGGTLFFFNKANLDSEIENESLLTDSIRKNKAMEENETKLQKYIAEVEEKRIEDQKRQWAAEGLSMVSKMLQSNADDLSKNYDNLVSALVKYVKANQAGLFVAEKNEKDEVLMLKACYAYDRKKYHKKTIEVGYGLVGQAYLERETTYLREIPEEYISITSGLGDAPPKYLLIVPIKSDDGIIGVLELAAFSDFEPHAVEFIERYAEMLYNSIISAKRNEQTQALLAQTQQQAEEMRAQEEEMRQNMEELVATQEEMERKEREYLQRIAELEAERVNAKENYVGQ